MLQPALRDLDRLTSMYFGAAYGIAIATPLAWEESRAEPDGVARTYLGLIAREPEAVARSVKALTAGLGAQAA